MYDFPSIDPVSKLLFASCFQKVNKNGNLWLCASIDQWPRSGLTRSRADGCRRSQFKEKVSGAKTDRAELAKVIRRLKPGDVFVVTRLDRLARSTRDLLNVLATIGEREAGFRSLRDAWADTTTPHGRLMLTVLGGLAEFERELIRARTGEGRIRAKGRGVRFGRPSVLTPAPAGRSSPAPCEWGSTGRSGTDVRCLAGDDLAACSSLIHA